MVLSSAQSMFRIHVLTANPAAITATQIASVLLDTRKRSAVSIITMTTAASNPATGRYNKRSAMIVPIGNSRLDAGNKLRKAKATNKKAKRVRFQRMAVSDRAAATASQQTQSSRLPRASEIWE